MNEELKVIISAEVDKLKKGTKDAQKQVKTFRDKVKDASKDVEKNFKAMGEGINKALKGVGVAVAGAVTGLVAMSAATEEYRNNQAKLITAFEQVGSSASVAVDTYRDLYRVLGDDGQATEAAAHLAQLTTNQDELKKITQATTGVYSIFGDSLPIESLTEAMNETA